MQQAIAGLKAQFNSTFQSVQLWVIYLVGQAVDGLKGGVSSAFDTLKKISDHFTSEVNAINNTLSTKASTTDLNNAVTGINNQLATKAEAAQVVTDIQTAKNSLINGATTLQDFAAVQTEIANMKARDAALTSGLAKDGSVLNIAATVALPDAPKDDENNYVAVRYLYVFNNTPAGPDSGVLSNATIAGFIPEYVTGDNLTLTNGDQLFVDYDDTGAIVGAQFHDDVTATKIIAELSAQREDFQVSQSAGKSPDSATLKSYLDENHASVSQINELKTELQSVVTTYFSIPNS